MVRFGRFRGANGFAFMITAAGDAGCDYRAVAAVAVCRARCISRLALRSRDADHLVGARHVLYRYVAVVIASRLREFRRSIEGGIGSWRGALKVFLSLRYR